MNLQGYVLQVRGGTERQINGHTYVDIPHGTQFSLFIGAPQGRRHDVEITISGKAVGTWRLNGQGYTIEGPADDAGQVTGKFTAYGLNTTEAALINAVDNDFTGLITATFYPELIRAATPVWRGGPPHAKGVPQSYGVDVGLSGQSDQRFGSAGRIERDYTAVVTINLRLVDLRQQPGGNLGPRPLLSTTVPPRI